MSEKTAKEIAQEILSGLTGGMSRRVADDEMHEGGAFAEIRHWGQWEPDEGDEDEEDNDHEVLRDLHARIMRDHISRFREKYLDHRIEWSAEEKNWIMITVRRR